MDMNGFPVDIILSLDMIRRGKAKSSLLLPRVGDKYWQTIKKGNVNEKKKKKKT